MDESGMVLLILSVSQDPWCKEKKKKVLVLEMRGGRRIGAQEEDRIEWITGREKGYLWGGRMLMTLSFPSGE